MADIDIERKGPGILPWIIGLLLLALLVWALFAFLGGDGDDTAVLEPAPVATAPSDPGAASPGAGTGAGTAAGTAALPAPVQEYVTSCAERQPGEMGLDHQYTSGCIQRLLAGIDAVLQQPNLAGTDVQAQLQAARQRAQQLTQSTQSTQHAGMTREAFLSAAAVLNGMQDARYPDLDGVATQLEETARSVQAGGNLLDQREPVQRFFQQAGRLLTGMAATQAVGA